MTSVEVHVPISPAPHFFNRMHYLAASLYVYASSLPEIRLIVTVGEDCEPSPIVLPWTKRYPIEFRRLERSLFREHSYFATRLKRFEYDFTGDIVLMLDPDVIAVGSIEPLIADAFSTQAFLGVVAHASPVRDGFTWEKLFAAADLPFPEFRCEHTGYGAMYDDASLRYCPAYFNLGTMAAPRRHMSRIGETIFEELRIAEQFSDFYRAQPAVTLGVYRHAIPWRAVGVRYNFPNDMSFVAKYPAEFEDMRLAHYLRYDNLHRERDFESPAAFAGLLARADLNPVNRAIADRLGPVHARVLEDLAA